MTPFAGVLSLKYWLLAIVGIVLVTMNMRLAAVTALKGSRSLFVIHKAQAKENHPSAYIMNGFVP